MCAATVTEDAVME